MSSDDKQDDTRVAIVDGPFSGDETEQPFGKRWGGECVTLTAEHLAALQAGKTLALDVQNEYVTFVRLQPTHDEVHQLAGQVSTLFVQAIQAANVEVDDIIQRGERDTARMDRQLDHMLGFCRDPDMLAAFKRLCRYYFTIDPVATAEHVNAYREMWDAPDESVAGE